MIAAQRIEEGSLHPDESPITYARQPNCSATHGASVIDQLGAEFDALRARIFWADTY